MTPKEFTAKKIKDISGEGIKYFPDDFLFPCDIDNIKLPSEILVIGNEFFGSYEVLTVKGGSFCHTKTLLKAKYLVYASRHKDRNIKIPVNIKDIEKMIKNYENYIDKILKQIEQDYRSLFPQNKDVNYIQNEVFRLLNLKRL